MIMRKMSIDSKINQYLVKGSIVFDFSILLIIINLVISVRACDVHEAEDGREEGDEEDVKQFPEKVFAAPVDAAWSGKSTQLMITFG